MSPAWLAGTADYAEQAQVTNWPLRILLVLVVAGARDLFVPAGAIEALRVDRGVAGTVRARDSVIIVTWRAGEALLDSGFRADDSDEHATVLDGLMATFASDLPEGRP